MIQVNLFTKQKRSDSLRQQTYSYHGEGTGGRDSWEFGMDMYKLLCFKMDKDLLYSAENSAQFYVAPGWE